MCDFASERHGFRKNIRRDEVDYLPEDRVYCLRCFWWCLFLHNPVGYRITPPVATLNIHPIANAVSEWDANAFYSISRIAKWNANEK